MGDGGRQRRKTGETDQCRASSVHVGEFMCVKEIERDKGQEAKERREPTKTDH